MSELQRIGDATLYLGDCLEILPTLEADALLTDPPYGVKRDKGFEGFGGFGKPIARARYEDDDWDSQRPAPAYFEAMLKAVDDAVIFGGNYFADLLPAGNHWIVWDKVNTMPTFGDCELAWTNIKRNSVKIITVEYNGLIGKEKHREHPTQKPCRLIETILRDHLGKAGSILDPFMGSGTTGVACANLGRKFIGVEIEPKYFDIACERIEMAQSQQRLFV